MVVLRVARDGTIRFANQHARELTGLPLEGESLAVMLVSSDREVDFRPWLEPAAEPRLMNVKVANGLPQTLYVTTGQVGSEFLLIGQPSPEEQERLRRDFLELNRELSALSRELALANAELDRLNRMKNQFLGMASHDLRKPAGIVLNYAELLLDQEPFAPGTRVRPPLERIRASAETMVRLINDFLDVAMIEAGRLNLDIQVVDPGKLFAESAVMVAAALEKRRIVLNTKLDESLQRLLVDGPKLEQVLTNLLSNAVEHSPDGGRVVMGIRRQAGELRFWVENEGAGLTPEQQQKLFREFAGTAVLKKDGERSVGLGLIIVRKIVEAHGGTVFVESQPGEGARFGFLLPERCAAA